jgi:hypothetical protein
VGSVFLVTLPLVGVAFLMAALYVPSHVNEATEPVDNLGGILSVVLVASLILAINFAPVPNKGALRVASRDRGRRLIAFVSASGARRTRCTTSRRRRAALFWVAALRGIIVFGSLMGAAFVSQQFLQNVLGYSTLEAGAAFLPAVVFMVLVAPRSAKLVEARGRGSRCSAATSSCCSPSSGCSSSGRRAAPTGDRPRVRVHRHRRRLRGTPASHSLTGSVPVERAGMASGTADLQRDWAARSCSRSSALS